MVQYRATRCNALQHMETRAGRPTSEGLHAAVQSTKGMIVAMVWCHSVRMKRRRDWAHRRHICAGTGLTASTSASGLGSPHHTFTKTGLPAATYALGVGSPPPHLHQDWSGKRGDVRRGCSVNDGAPTCILHVSSCMLPVAVVCCLLRIVCCLLRIACCLSSVVCRLLRVVCCMLRVAYCMLRVACCLLFVARCALRVAH
jgi:hypothetical protein